MYTGSTSTSNGWVYQHYVSYWTAGHRIGGDQSSTFRWNFASGISYPMMYTNWAADHPSNNRNEAYCSALYVNNGYKWASWPCTASLYFLCEVYPEPDLL